MYKISRVITGALLTVALGFTGTSQAAEPAVAKLTLISNVNIFDGENEKLLKNMHVLVKDNLIETISDEPLVIPISMARKMADTSTSGSTPWFEPVEILRMATSTAGELFALSGEMRNPYQEGTLGTVSEGGYADLLLVEGNPLEDLGAVTNVDNLKIIMKDGVIYKNTL